MKAKALFVALTLFWAWYPHFAQANKKPSDWVDNKFCGTPLCDREMLWIKKIGSVLLRWKENTLTIMIKSGGYEHVITMQEGTTHELFRKQIWITCNDCPAFKDGSKVVYDVWEEQKQDSKRLDTEPWVKNALASCPASDKRLAHVGRTPSLSTSQQQ